LVCGTQTEHSTHRTEIWLLGGISATQEYTNQVYVNGFRDIDYGNVTVKFFTGAFLPGPVGNAVAAPVNASFDYKNFTFTLVFTGTKNGNKAVFETGARLIFNSSTFGKYYLPPASNLTQSTANILMQMQYAKFKKFLVNSVPTEK
jgi:hypothetical protein